MAIWKKLFSKITFKDYPDTSTPLNADNLNKMTDAIDGIDDRVVELNSNFNNSIETDHKTYTNIKGSDHAGLKISDSSDVGYVVQLQANGELTKWHNDGSGWKYTSKYIDENELSEKANSSDVEELELPIGSIVMGMRPSYGTWKECGHVEMTTLGGGGEFVQCYQRIGII